MRILALLALLTGLLAGCGHQPRVPQVSAGSLELHASFASQFVAPRTIYVWLPDSYPALAPYAVVYMHDGQMLFDAALTWNGQEWGVDEVAGGVAAKGTTRPFIVVGIDNAGAARHAEYFPEQALAYITPDGVPGDHPLLATTLLGDEYLRFLVTELKPFVETRYAVGTGPGDAFLLGSSMGGLISLYGFVEYPDEFGGAACLSTHWPGIDPDDPLPVAEAIFSYLSRRLPNPSDRRIYFDHGTETLDAYYPQLQRRVDALMRKRGYDESNWRTRVFAGAEHDENAWRARLHLPLEFLLEHRP